MSTFDKPASWFDWAEECESLPIYNISTVTPAAPPTSSVPEESSTSSSIIPGSTTDETATTSSAANTATVTTDDDTSAGWFEPSTDTEIPTHAQPPTDAEPSDDTESSNTETLANVDAILRDAVAQYDRYPIHNGPPEGVMVDSMCPFAVRTMEEPHNIVPLMVLLAQGTEFYLGRPIPGFPIPPEKELRWSLEAHNLSLLEWHALNLLETEHNHVAALQALRKRNIAIFKDYIHQRNLYRICVFANDKKGIITAMKTVANDVRKFPSFQRFLVETILSTAVGRERAQVVMNNTLSLDRAGAQGVMWFVGYNDVDLKGEGGRVSRATGPKPYTLPLIKSPQVAEGLLSKPIRCRIHAIIWPRFHPACMVKFFRQHGELYAEPEPKLTDKPEEFSNLTILREVFRGGRWCWKLDGRE